MSEPFQNETYAPASAVAGDVPSGAAALSKKVKSLRLSDAAMRDGSGNSKLPWLLCLVLAGSTAYFAWQLYGTSPAAIPVNDQGNAAAAVGAQATQGTVKSDNARPGSVVLLSTGYVVPAH